MILRIRPVAKWAVAIAGVLAGAGPAIVPAASADGGYAATRVQVGRAVYSVTADPTTNTVYALYATSDLEANKIAVIDGAAHAVSATISLGFTATVVTVDPVSDTVYAFGRSTAAVINGATNTVTATISMPPGAVPIAAAVNPVTHMVYAMDYLPATVIAINGGTNAVAATIPITDPVNAPDAVTRGVAVDTSTNQVYVSDTGDNQVAVIDGTTNAVTSRITLPSHAYPAGLTVDPGAGQVYVADQGTNAVSVIAVATGTVTATITGITSPAGPLAVAVDPGTGRLYVTARVGSDSALAYLGATYVIDTASQAIITQFPRGGSAITMDAASGGSAYIADGTVAGPLMGSVDIIMPGTANTMSPVIVGSVGFAFTTSQAGQDQLQASAAPAAAFSATGLPAGLTLSPHGLLSGTPALGTGGFYDIAMTATNGVAPPDNELLYLSIYQPASITSADHAAFRTGTAGTFTVTADGFPAVRFSETGALPNGVTLSPAGALSGTPASGSGGRYQIHLTATNDVGSPATQAFTLTVQQPPSFASPDEVTFKVGVRKSFTIVTHGFPAPQLAESGKLPEGIAFRTSGDGTARLSGRALRRARGHTFSVVIKASNGVGPAVRQVLTIRIR